MVHPSSEKDGMLQDRITQNAEALGMPYPGFDSPERRRTCDESVRRRATRVLGDMLQQIASLDAYLARENAPQHRAALAAARGSAESLSDKIQSVPYSFAPLFQVVFLPLDIQRRLADDDLIIIEAIAELERFLEPTLGENTGFGALIERAESLIEALDKCIEDRVSTIMEFAG